MEILEIFPEFICVIPGWSQKTMAENAEMGREKRLVPCLTCWAFIRYSFICHLIPVILFIYLFIGFKATLDCTWGISLSYLLGDFSQKKFEGTNGTISRGRVLEIKLGVS